MRDPVLAVPLEAFGPDHGHGEPVDRLFYLLLSAGEGEVDVMATTRQTNAFCDSALGSTSPGSMGRPSSIDAAS